MMGCVPLAMVFGIVGMVCDQRKRLAILVSVASGALVFLVLFEKLCR